MTASGVKRFGAMGDDEDELDDLDSSVYGDFLAEAQAEVAKPPIELEVNTRRNISIQYSIDIDSQELQRWRDRCTSRDGKHQDFTRFCATVVANQMQHFTFKGVVVPSENHEVLKFRNREFFEMYNAVEMIPAIRKFFGKDSHMIAHATAVLEAAGYDENGMAVNKKEDGPLA